MRTARQLIVLGLSASAVIANAGEPCRIVDSNGNFILLSLGGRLEASVEGSFLQFDGTWTPPAGFAQLLVMPQGCAKRTAHGA